MPDDIKFMGSNFGPALQLNEKEAIHISVII